MKRYRFNLEAALQQRRLIYDQKARELAAAIHQLSLAMQRLESIRQRKSETASAFEEKKQKGLEVRDAALYAPFLDQISAEERKQLLTVHEAEAQARAAQQALDQARIQYEIMQKLKAKSREAYERDFRREEQHFLDEVGNNRYKLPSSGAS
jgi:flagellar export protein FliJ